MPAYNEEKTIEESIIRVLSQESVAQLIVVDDASTDNTLKILSKFSDSRLKIVSHAVNKGKGASLASALPFIQQPFTIIQDADLEYDPAEYSKLLHPILMGKADVVYGSRFLGSGEKRVLYFWHYVANRILTLLSNCFTNLNLSDMETCYKLVKSETFHKISLKEKRFGIEPELTAKFAKLKLKFYEVPINYYGRTYQDGKKIRFHDAFRAVYSIFRYNLFN